MLDTLKSFLKDLTKGDVKKHGYQEDDTRLAAAALLFHIIAVDGTVEDVEIAALNDTLKQHYHLDDSQTKELIEQAKERDEESVDLYGFTSVLKRELDEQERLTIIEMMWKMVYADGSVHEFEDNTIWRVAELLGVSSRDRMDLKHKVAQSYAKGR
ncbi:tellurite resistance TerB family protein [Flexibacterium corallicola]|uniref:tellurite resistance TerB family protein n=1 Tax=Flexibacterium corallicola TaxID=3037259 RepID=UPI00286F4E39|nr:TerB family tellurite resistance protein [Pseudovibrio sp. M1P-2-3]